MLGELASHGVIDDLSLAVATTADLGGYDEKKPKNTNERRNLNNEFVRIGIPSLLGYFVEEISIRSK